MTFPLPPNEAAFIAELQRQLGARFVDEDEPAEPAAPSMFQIPASVQLELDRQQDEAA